MSVRPPLPRRTAPPTPMQQDFTHRNQLQSSVQESIRPVLPPRSQDIVHIAKNRLVLSDVSPEDLSRLLARKPPAPPIRIRRSSILPSSVTTPKAGMTLTPFAVALQALASPPPPVNLASKPVVNVPEPEAVNVSRSCLRCRDFSIVDAHAASFPRRNVASLEELAYALAQPFGEEIEKVRAVFTWLHYNIIYDTESFFSGNIQSATPESTLASGLAVCDGYAGLFERLTELMGFQTYKVTGHGKGYGHQTLTENEDIPEYRGNHAWNCININGEWQLVDPCWGSGHLDGSGVYQPVFAAKWFTNSSIEFGMRHFPEDPTFQLMPKEVTWEEYMATDSPDLTPIFDSQGLDSLTIQPASKTIPDRAFLKFSISKRCEHMSTSEEDNYVYVINTGDKDFSPLMFNNQIMAWEANIFTPRSGKVTLFSVDTVDGKDAYGMGVAMFNKAKGRKAMTFQGLAVWNIKHIFEM